MKQFFNIFFTKVEKKRDAEQQELKELENTIGPLLAVLDNQQTVKQLLEQKQFHLGYLKEQYKISADMVERLHEYGKRQFEMADYGSAADYLLYYRLLIDNTFQDLSKVKRSYGTRWGILAAKILLNDFDGALSDLTALREILDGPQATLIFDTSVEQFQHRCWIIHWSLFVFFNHQNGKNAIIDLFFQEK